MAPKKVWLVWSWPWYSPEFSGGLAFDGLLIRERFTHSDKKRHGMPSKDLKIFFWQSAYLIRDTFIYDLVVIELMM